jgi:hypothetical protein
MSTSYYRLKEPFTSVRVERRGSHDAIRIWVEHGLSGELIVPHDVTPEVLRALAQHGAAAQISAGRDGPVLHRFDRTLTDDTQVVSEYGELTTLREEVDERQRARKGRVKEEV